MDIPICILGNNYSIGKSDLAQVQTARKQWCQTTTRGRSMPAPTFCPATLGGEKIPLAVAFLEPIHN